MNDGPEEFAAASGARLAIPDELRQAVRTALPAAGAQADGLSAEQVFLQHLVEQMHLQGIILMPRARTRTKSAVNADLYGLALSAKYAADERVHAIAMLMGPLPGPPDRPDAGRPSLCAEFQGLVDQLTGHAPPAGVVERLGSFEERLRRLRYVALGTPIDAELQDPPVETPAAEVVAELFRGEAR